MCIYVDRGIVSSLLWLFFVRLFIYLYICIYRSCFSSSSSFLSLLTHSHILLTPASVQVPFLPPTHTQEEHTQAGHEDSSEATKAESFPKDTSFIESGRSPRVPCRCKPTHAYVAGPRGIIHRWNISGMRIVQGSPKIWIASFMFDPC